MEHYRQAVGLNPEYVQGLCALARILATNADPAVRDGKEAVRLAEIACAKTGQADPQALDALACASAETGRFDDALRAVDKAIGLALSAKDEKLTAAIEAHRKLFEAHKPARE